EAGFTASPDALEHPQGFLSAVSPAGNVDRSDPVSLGTEWRILSQGLGIKKYPTCYCTHRSIDAMLDLMQRQPLKPGDIKQMTVSISENFSTILRNHAPDTGLAAKFSMEFAVSSAVIARRVGLAELTDDFVRRPDVQALMGRVRIALADGGTVETEQVRRATGHPTRPLSDAQLYEKFRDCLEVGKSQVPAEALFQRLRDMQQLQARQITALH